MPGGPQRVFGLVTSPASTLLSTRPIGAEHAYPRRPAINDVSTVGAPAARLNRTRLRNIEFAAVSQAGFPLRRKKSKLVRGRAEGELLVIEHGAGYQFISGEK